MGGKRWISSTFAALAVAIGIAVVGCGSSGESDTATASITKAEFITKASAICARLHKQAQAEFLDYLKNHGEEPGTAAAVAALQAELAEKYVISPKQQEADELAALGAPSGGESQVKAIVVSLEEGVEEAEGKPVQAANDSSKAFGEAEKLASEYGLTGC
jgi:hypothetical protein